MLILERGIGQSILIGGRTVTVKVLDARGGRVRLGITAPREVSVDREEIYQRKELEQASRKLGAV